MQLLVVFDQMQISIKIDRSLLIHIVLYKTEILEEKLNNT